MKFKERMSSLNIFGYKKERYLNEKQIRRRLEKSQNKVADFEEMVLCSKNYISVSELLQLISDFLNDEQIKKLLAGEQVSKINKSVLDLIFRLIKDINIVIEIFKLPYFASEYQAEDIIDILKLYSKESILICLKDKEFLEKIKVASSLYKDIIPLFSDEYKDTFLKSNKEIIPSYGILEIIKAITSEETKVRLMNEYESEIGLYKTQILASFSDKYKSKIIINEDKPLSKDEIEMVFLGMSIENQIQFIINNNNFLRSKNIDLPRIIKVALEKEPIKFVEHMEDMGLTEVEKKYILVEFGPKIKNEIDTANWPQEYIDMLDSESTCLGIIVSIDANVESYKDMGESICINPLNIPSEKKEKIEQFIAAYPNIKIIDDLMMGVATVSEYRNGEAWIEKLLEGAEEHWSILQKCVYVDDAIGKKISYSPDFRTEVSSASDSRSLWKIIDSGYGVCNGISQIAQYILGKMGIESEMLNSSNHAFSLIKNVEIPCEDGSTKTGDTIWDFTWNLFESKYGLLPNFSATTYEEILTHDIDVDGENTESHNIGERAEGLETIGLDNESRKQLYASMGLCSGNGIFPMHYLLYSIDKLKETEISNKEKIEKSLKLLSEHYPEFSSCQMETMSAINYALLCVNLNYDKCVIKRVYNKDDSTKTPVIYVYADIPDEGKCFFVAEKGWTEFSNISEEEFIAKYECYNNDLKLTNGHRPWETKIEELNQKEQKGNRNMEEI